MVCSEICNNNAKKTNRAYFLFYNDNPKYRYEIAPADTLIYQNEESLLWNELNIKFILTLGHSCGSMCIDINNLLITGDTIMPYKPYFNGRDSNEEEWKESVTRINKLYPSSTRVNLGRGDDLTLGEWIQLYVEK